METMKIDMNEISKICEIFINKAKERGFESIEMDKDYYWHVAWDERDNFKAQPNNFLVGSIYDDMYWLKRFLREESVVTTVDFERLGNVFITIAQIIDESDKLFY